MWKFWEIRASRSLVGSAATLLLPEDLSSKDASPSMIGNGSTLRVTDNSGARLVQCINQTGRSFGVGDLITVAVKKAVKGKVAAGTVRRSVCCLHRAEASDRQSKVLLVGTCLGTTIFRPIKKI